MAPRDGARRRGGEGLPAAVKAAEVLENTVSEDAAMVGRCVSEDLRGRAFHPPEADMATELTVTVLLADKC